MRSSRRLLLLSLCLLPLTTTAQEFGRSVIVRDAMDNDLYAAGGDVEVQAAIGGDAVLAGQTVVVAGAVDNDVIAAGRTIRVSGSVADDVRLAGRTVTVSGNVAGHAVIAGGEARIESGSSIEDWAWIAAGRVYIAGTIGGEVKAVGGSIEFSGQVDGDVELGGERIRIGDGAVINGDLVWRSENKPRISDDALIAGEIREGPPLRDFRPRRGFLSRIYALLGIIFAAGVLYTLFRGICADCLATLKSTPWMTLGVGFAVLAITPVVIFLLYLSGIGALLGTVVLLDYLLAILLGGLSGIVLVARFGHQRFRDDANPSLGATWAGIAVVTVIMSLLYILRPVGIVVSTFVLLFGLGALSLVIYRRVKAWST